MRKKLIGSLFAGALVVLTACADDDDGAAEAEVTSQETTATTAASATTAGGTATTAAQSATTAAAAAEITGLDETFGTAGVKASPLSTTTSDRFMAIAAAPGGGFYAAGFTTEASDQSLSVSKLKADGSLDTAFGTAGVASVNVAVGGKTAEVARAVAVQSDGKVLIGGPFEHDPKAAGDAAKDLDIAVARFDATGKPDTTFGTGGVAKVDLGTGRAVNENTYLADTSWGLGVLSTGRIVVFGATPAEAADRTDADYALVGLTSAGALDSAFATAGVLRVDLESSGDSPRNLLVHDDDSIAATGYSRDGDGVVSPVVIKTTAGGTLDTTFGEGGIANHVVLPGVTESYNLSQQGEDYILAGYGRGADANEKVDLVVYRFTAAGELDTTFGTSGVTRLDLAKEDDRARNVMVLPDGRILAIGSGKLTADNVDAMAVLLEADGQLVSTFGDGGHALTDLGGPSDAFYGVTLAEDGKSVLIAGYKGVAADGGQNDDAALARIAL
jgi:uncharacterized delta-60 repeat protein